VELGPDGAPLGTINVEANGADPWLGDGAGSPLHDLVVCGCGLGMPGRTKSDDAVPAPGSLGTVHPGITGLLLPGPPGSSSPSIDYG
jgi:hypothetical protein